ncbi:PD-(D/E)XK nuclease family protein [Facklamia sp. DSM 111018]|uniref:PD-(D/E)XK nuclease family protein n=1 Tax=Facklamia lactis TaxID=2749967 RepID=A0ABS0LMT2_9LACT|nr:PD-(D/E)XK nuclease family protein [Facklamia lactis]MBG9979866.1 PD-(D/E)XK nuclease family protein [Facklamia lactis]MBG9985454.1 PD-(D/E)XK nuclease family protein [Facklamia lactis]
MSIQIITGDLKYNKKEPIIDHLLDILEKDPTSKIFYIVPEHLKFNMEEYTLAQIRKRYQRSDASLFNFQVASFSRLKWFLVNHKSDQDTLSDLGLTMIVRQVLNQYQHKLHVYRKQVNYQSFAETIMELFKEFIEGNISPEDITDFSFQEDLLTLATQADQMEGQRLAEIKFLYQAFLDHLQELEINNYKMIQNLIHFFQTEKLEKHYFVIDHYYYFSSQELQILLAMAQASEKIWITLPITQQQLKSYQDVTLNKVAFQTYAQIKELSQLLNIPFDAPWEINACTFKYQPQIQHIADKFSEYQHHYEVSTHEKSHNDWAERHYFYEFDSIQTELRYVSNKIHQLVVEEGYRYKDIQVFTRNMERYQSLVDPIFKMNNIPYFFDHEKTMMDHPFFDWVIKLIQLEKYNWRIPDIIGILKSPLFIPPKIRQIEDADQRLEALKNYEQVIFSFENMLIENGYEGYRFYHLNFEWSRLFDPINSLSDKNDTPSSEPLEQMLEIRQWMISEIHDPLIKLKKVYLGSDFVTKFYRLIQESGIKDQLETLRNECLEQGLVGEARQHEQVWQVFTDTLDEFAKVFSNDQITYELFTDILTAGFKAATYHIIPPTLDQVAFTNIVSPQIQPNKIAFIIGMDRSSLPQKIENNPILTRENRQSIQSNLLAHQFLVDKERQQGSLETLLAYQILLLATDQLHFSYAINLEDRLENWSPFIKQIIRIGHFKTLSLDANYDIRLEGEARFINNFGNHSSFLTTLLQSTRKIYESKAEVPLELAGLIQLVDNQTNKPYHRNLSEILKLAIRFDGLPENITTDTALKLYGQNLNLSVSRIEQFFQDPYSHFLLYGLKLKERKRYEIDFATTGEFFHQALDYFSKYLKANNLLAYQLNDSKIHQAIQKVLTGVKQNPDFEIYQQQGHTYAIFQQIEKRLSHFIRFSIEQQKLIRNQPLISEAIFGMPGKDSLPGLIYPLPSGGKLIIRGKIDRIDEINYFDNQYLQIIDYKSSNKKFSLVDAYYGMDLQILTYLAVGLRHYPDHQPLGAFYQPIIQSFDKANGFFLESNSEHITELQLNNNKLNGFITIEADYLKELELGASESNKSLVYPVQYKKEGFYASSPTFNSEELEVLVQYTHLMFKEAAAQIQQGEIHLAPFEDHPYTTSINEPFRVITGFDASQNYHYYRHKTISSDQAIEAMKAKLIENGLLEKEEDIERK